MGWGFFMARPEKGQKKVTTVWLEPEIDGYSDKTKMFFCFNCRVPVIQYTSNVVSIVPGGSPYNPSTSLKCKGSVQDIVNGTWAECGQFYSFVAAVYTKSPEMT